MKTKFFLFSLAVLSLAFISHAQVGVGNTNPQATLDITASNTANPANNDGILIPRMSAFPSTSPTATQDGMLIFYTGTGASGKGFYYWDNNTTSWIYVFTGTKNTLDQAYDEGGAGNGRTITADNGALQVNGTDGVLVSGTFGTGASVSTSGSGTRMFFNPQKAAFRAGNVTANQWDDANIGDYSVAMGRATTASSTYTTAIGFGSIASGSYSTTLGWANTASGAYSMSLGQDSNATGWSSTALGRNSTASGYQSLVFGNDLTASATRSFAIGNYVSALSGYEIAIGNYNTTYSPVSTTLINSSDRLFSIGNGTSTLARSNALTIYKSGLMNINDAYNMPLTDGTNGQVMTTDGVGNISFADAPGGTLDQAYDHGGAGAGRTINATDGAVQITNDGLQVTGIGTSGILGTFTNTGIPAGTALLAASTSTNNTNVRSAIRALNTLGGMTTDISKFGSSSERNAGVAIVGPSNLDGVSVALENLNTLNFSTDTRGYFFDMTYNGGINGTIYGYKAEIEGSGAATKYGAHIAIPSTSGGTQYGIYSDVRNTSGYAGYFLGRTSLGTGTTNRYLMPASDGSSGQVMATNGTGTVSFVNPSTIFTDTDDQTIDNFSLVGTTLGLSLEADGQPIQTVDLSSLQDDDWTEVGANIERQSGNVYIGDTSNTNNDLYISDYIYDWDDLTYFLNPNGDNRMKEIEFDAGSTADPSIRFADINSGFFSPANAVTAYSANGSEAFRIQNDGELSIGLTTPSNYLLKVNSLSNLNQVSIGNDNLSSDNVMEIVHGAQRGNSIDISVNSTYTLATRSAVSAFNNNGDTQVNMAKFASGTFNTYGLEVAIPVNGSGVEYGIYSNVQTTNGFSGYFLGDVAIGTASTNTYILPASRGTNGQIMQTDGFGNLSWVAPSTSESTTASNGLTEATDDIRLGGILTQATTIAQGTNNFDINLNSTGDFAIQDNGTDVFFVEDSGDIGFGTNNPNYRVDVQETGNNELRGISVTKTDNSTSDTNGIYVSKTGSGTGRSHAYYSLVQGTGTGQKYGLFNRINTTAAGNQYGVRNWISGNTSGQQFGTFNNLANDGTSDVYGVYNGMRVTNASNMYGVYNEFLTANSSSTLVAGVRNRFTNGTPGSDGFAGTYTDFALTANGTYYGTRNEYAAGATGTGTKYGTFNEISSSAGGTHYGTYNDVSTASGWAGYFLGRNYISDRLSIGETNNADASLNVLVNSGGTISHIELKENAADDGARIRMTNTVETTNEWLIFGRADNTIADSRFNINHTTTGNIIHIRGDGRVGINDSNPTYALELPNNATAALGQGRANAWVTYSDGRVKKDQRIIAYGLETILKMQPKSYTHYSSSFQNGALQLDQSNTSKTVGFIAQELLKVLPEATFVPKNENEELWSIDYEKIIPVTVKAIQELNDKIETLEAENLTLKQQLNTLQSLEARLQALEQKASDEISSASVKPSED